MKIVICSSVSFAKKILEIKAALEKFGYEVFIPENIQKFADGIKKPEEHSGTKVHGDLILNYYKKILNSDAVLILNLDKKNIKGYIGGNVLIEMGFAHVLKKPIYLFNQVPKMQYSDEIMAMMPIVINGNLSQILEK